ncbi:MAG: DNA adenine methylase [Chloroflexi bacterium]|nr:DNA adenine methylase [Chloroflexota bacterium]
MSDPASELPVPGRTTPEAPNQVGATPFLKWAGGKRPLVPDIAELMPASFERYWEPFVGGGAVFFALGSGAAEAYLSDLNLELMVTYKVVQDDPEALISHLERHADEHSREHYYAVRAKHDERDPIALAARFIYLNKTAYNGLHRVNKRGRFNVPMGSYEDPGICDAGNLRAASIALGRARLRAGSFLGPHVSPAVGDVVYCDPPYDGTFTGYTGAGFGSDEQTALRDRATVWADSGAHVLLSNSDTPFIRDLYQSWTLHQVQAPRNINSNGAGRNKVNELLIVSA